MRKTPNQEKLNLSSCDSSHFHLVGAKDFHLRGGERFYFGLGVKYIRTPSALRGVFSAADTTTNLI